MTVSVPGALTFTYTEDGTTTVFSYPVRFLEQAELLVIREIIATGVRSTLVLGADYTVSGSGNPSGGSITRTAATNGGRIIITRKTQAKQVVDLADAARTPADSVEVQLDRLAMVAQDHQQSIDSFEGDFAAIDAAVAQTGVNAAAAAGSAAASAASAVSADLDADRADAAADQVDAILAGLSVGSTGLEMIQSITPSAARKAAAVRGRVNFFDFLKASGRSATVMDQITTGTYTGDLAVEWQQFRDALQAIATGGGRPHGFIPECKIYSTVAPNFAMDYLTLETQGHVRIQGKGATIGFQVDGMGLGVGGYGVRHLNIGPLCASSETGGQGAYIRRAHKSDFWGLQSLGGSFAAVQIDGCVTSYFHKPTVSPQAEAFLQTPSLGMYVSGSSGGAGPEPWRAMIPTSWCRFEMPVMEYTGVGIQFDNTYGNKITGGTAEGCSNIGMILGAAAEFNKIYGIDLEANTTRDLEVQGKRNSFVDVDSQTIALFTLGTCLRNRVIGGHFNQLTLDSGTKRNLILGASVTSLTDNSTGADRNRVSAIADDAGNWTDRWITWNPAVTSSTNTITTAASFGEYKIRDGDTIDFHITITITTNGTGAGTVRINLPFATAVNSVFSGTEIGLSGRGITGAAGGSGTLVDIRNASDGSYPGANGAVLVLAGTYRRS